MKRNIHLNQMTTSVPKLMADEPVEKTTKYMLFCEEMREKNSSSTTIHDIAAAYKKLSDKELKALEVRAIEKNKQLKVAHEKWLKQARDAGYPDYPKYNKVSMNIFFKDNFKGSSEAGKVFAYAVGGFSEKIAEDFKLHMKVKKPSIQDCLNYIEKDPKNLFGTVKEAKVYDHIIAKYQKKEMVDN